MGQGAPTKALSIRLPVQQAEALETLAYFDRCSVAEEIRQAITNHIELRRGDERYIARMLDELHRRREMIEQFAGPRPGDASPV